MALMNCPECGREISDHAESCPGCGYKISTTDKVKNYEKENGKTSVIFLGIAGAAILVVAISVLISLGSTTEKATSFSDNYDDLKWYISSEDLENQYDDELDLLYSDDRPIIYVNDYADIDGLSAMVIFELNDSDKLYEITVAVYNNTKFSDSMLVDKVEEYLSDEYGDSDMTKDGYQWKTKTSEIKLESDSGGFFVDYEPIY